ncbi:hypothetical protein MUK42_16115 [Musa troglodytarum]|uniref:Serine aminopeptidase S33 domain-containing protein n=1 Tax=Musa troglodytarum TaxID=320322 RepID=A0A9E7I4X8_9LILI|nr:hypothetical protein MUK42_16115 [Musa troglodytarum]
MASYFPSVPDEASAIGLLLQAVALVPTAHYLAAAVIFLLVFLYNFLELHFLGDFLRGFRGDPVVLTFDPASRIYQGVVSMCQILHGRQLFSVQDGGTVALDWLLASDVAGGASDTDKVISRDDTTPIVVVVPGLTSDSFSSYVKHAAYTMAKHGWNVVVSNHRGLGGISITSDCFYNAGWTEDLREVVNYLHYEYWRAPLFAVGTSIGANILVKYLGEDGENTPIAGAVSVCSPWDLVVCDRFISRKLVQRFYDKALTIGLKGYAQFHALFGTLTVMPLAMLESLSVGFIGNVAVPLLCISSLDDPVCTREAIPWDECRANQNIVLATTAHGGHLAYFEGLTAHSLWWVGAVREFLNVLHSSEFMHGQIKTPNQGLHCSLESAIDKGPYVNITEDGMVAAMTSEGPDRMTKEDLHDDVLCHVDEPEDEIVLTDQSLLGTDNDTDNVSEPVDSVKEIEAESITKAIHDVTAPVKRSINQVLQHCDISMWLLAYIAIVTTWPLLGSALSVVFKRKLRGRERDQLIPMAIWWTRGLATSRSSRGDGLVFLLALLAVLSLLTHELSRHSILASAADFEGFDPDGDDLDVDLDTTAETLESATPAPPATSLSGASSQESHHGPPAVPSPPSDLWDEDEFEGIPPAVRPPDHHPDSAADDDSTLPSSKPVELSSPPSPPLSLRSYFLEIACVTFLICFAFNYFHGKRRNEAIALAWAAKFAVKDSIFDKNFSLLGTGDGNDTPLLLKEGQDVFKFYASGRRYCQGMLATMELLSRHDLISRAVHLVLSKKDTITFEVVMNEDAMDHVVLALARKKTAKMMHKEERDLQRFASPVVAPPAGRKWVADELMVVAESKEVAGDLITDVVLDQVFGDKAFEKFGKWFVSLHFSDQSPGSHKKILMFKFVLPGAKNISDMSRLVTLVPYYIDLKGRYKLSSHAQTEAARAKAAQEAHKELQNARQEAMQKKKAEKKKLMEEVEAKLGAEALRKKEDKERARQLKKAGPRLKMLRR